MDHEPLNILIIEDEDAHAELTQRAILKANRAHRIDIVTDGEEALNYIFHRGRFSNEMYPVPNLILLDIKLPGINGIEVLKQIKADPDLRQIPVVMLTTSDREEDVSLSYRHHANSYLTKPVGFKAFEEKVIQLGSYWLSINKPPSLQ